MSRARIGEAAMEMLDHLTDRYGEDYSTGAVLIVVDVITGADRPTNPVTYFCNDPRRWVQVALLREALDEAETLNERRVEESATESDETP